MNSVTLGCPPESRNKLNNSVIAGVGVMIAFLSELLLFEGVEELESIMLSFLFWLVPMINYTTCDS